MIHNSLCTEYTWMLHHSVELRSVQHMPSSLYTLLDMYVHTYTAVCIVSASVPHSKMLLDNHDYKHGMGNPPNALHCLLLGLRYIRTYRTDLELLLRKEYNLMAHLLVGML